MSYESKLNSLREWGCDVTSALHRVVDDVEFYFKCLGEFVDDENFNSLDTSLLEEDLDTAFDSAHTIKGVSGNLGLTPVYNAALELVEPLRLRERRDYSKQLSALHAQHEKLRDIVG